MKPRLLAIMLALLCSLPLPGWGAEAEIGKVVAVRGTATIARGGKSLPAQPRTPLLLSDTVRTAAASKAKLLFVDDSSLTLGEKATLVVKDFVAAKGQPGKSLFNLIDGKMRAVVGRTRFEVETPTAVAAARGTVIFFEVGIADNRPFTLIASLEGEVEVHGVVAGLTDQVVLTPGHMVVVRAGEGAPEPVRTPPAVFERAGRLAAAGVRSAPAAEGRHGVWNDGGFVAGTLSREEGVTVLEPPPAGEDESPLLAPGGGLFNPNPPAVGDLIPSLRRPGTVLVDISIPAP